MGIINDLNQIRKRIFLSEPEEKTEVKLTANEKLTKLLEQAKESEKTKTAEKPEEKGVEKIFFYEFDLNRL